MNDLPTWWNAETPYRFGDCIDIMAEIPNDSVDIVFADPPFNLGKDYGDTSNDSRSDYAEWCEAWIGECFRILKPTGSFFHMNYPDNMPKIWPIMSKYGTFRNCIIWKNTKMPTKNKFVVGYQPILFYTKGDNYTFNHMAETKPLETFIPGTKKGNVDRVAQLTDI